MIRITVLTFLIAFLSVYAWKNWFNSACWLVLLMAVFQHPDMPKAIGGIPGLNHWNFLFVNVVLSWIISRKKLGLIWDMPKHLNFLLVIYSILIITSCLRFMADMSVEQLLIDTYGGKDLSISGVVNEYIINCFKWVLPSFIIFDGCRNRKQYNFALSLLLCLFVLLALQVIKAMKLGVLTLDGDHLQRKALKVISSNVGYHRVNISMIMSGAFWAVFCLKEFVTKKTFFFVLIPLCGLILLAMAMTGGRMGYVTWGLIGLVISVFKWRKNLLLLPVMFFALIIVAPSALERMTQGFTPDNQEEVYDTEFSDESVDLHSVTSGRVIAWPLVWESIKEAPFIGYGRSAMKNIGITQFILEEYGLGETFPHPHNAYLQWIQDNGFIGFIPVLLFYIFIVRYSWCLFKDDRQKIYVVTGGVCLSITLGFLIASIGSQTFYPREGAVGMWVSIGLLLRVYVERLNLDQGLDSELIKPKDDFVPKYFVRL